MQNRLAGNSGDSASSLENPHRVVALVMNSNSRKTTCGAQVELHPINSGKTQVVRRGKVSPPLPIGRSVGVLQSTVLTRQSSGNSSTSSIRFR